MYSSETQNMETDLFWTSNSICTGYTKTNEQHTHLHFTTNPQ